MSNQSEQTEQKSKGSCLGELLTGFIILVIISCIIAYFTYDPDRRTLSYDNANKIMLMSKSRLYNQLNRDGAVVKEFPRSWDSWKFDKTHTRTIKRDDTTIASYRLTYYVKFILAGMELETDVVVDVDHNETTGTLAIRKVSAREFNKYVGQLLQRRR